MLDHALQLCEALERASREPPKTRSILAPYFAAIYESREAYHSPSPSPEPSSPHTSNTSQASKPSRILKNRASSTQHRKKKRPSLVNQAGVSKSKHHESKMTRSVRSHKTAYRQKPWSLPREPDTEESDSSSIVDRRSSLKSHNILGGYHGFDGDTSMDSDGSLDSFYSGRYCLRSTTARKRRASGNLVYYAT